MNFIKLIPILFLARPSVGEARPIGLQVLPSVPGYIPVYIQTGNVPPNVEALYQGKSAISPLPKRNILTKMEPVKASSLTDENKELADKVQIIQPPRHIVDIPKVTEDEDRQKLDQVKDPKSTTLVKTVKVQNIEGQAQEKVALPKLVYHKRDETKTAVEPKSETTQYEVKEPEQE